MFSIKQHCHDKMLWIVPSAKARYILTFHIYFWKLVLPALAFILVFIDVWVFCFALFFVMPTVFFKCL